MRTGATAVAVSIYALTAFGCQGQQYVSPDTVQLSVSDASVDPPIERVSHCHYIPVLLGDQIQGRYRVTGELDAVMLLTRERVTISFEGESAGGEAPPPPWVVPSSVFRDKRARAEPSTQPAGLELALMSPCVPED